MKKRILSILLTLCMVLMLVPATVFAEGDCTITYNFKYGTYQLGGVKAETSPYTYNSLRGNEVILGTVIDCAPYKFVGWKETGSGTVYAPNSDTMVNDNMTFEALYEVDGSLAITVDGFEVGNTPNDCTYTFDSTIPGIEFSEDDLYPVYWEKYVVDGTVYSWAEVIKNEVFQAETTYRLLIALHSEVLELAPAVTVNGKTPESCKIWYHSDGTPYNLTINCEFGTPAEPVPTITIDGPDVICAQQEYEFTATAPEGVTLDKGFGFDTGGKGSGVDLTIDENGVGHGVMLTEWYDLNTNYFDLSVYGYTADQQFVSATKRVQVSQDHVYVDGVCGCGAVLQYIVEYIGSGDDPICMEVKPHGKDLTLRGETFTKDGYVQTGWEDKEGNRYKLGGTYSQDADMTFYPIWDEILTLSVPFTTTVALGDAGEPGETSFELVLIDGSGNELTYEDEYFTAVVNTDGAGDYDGFLTITAPLSWLKDMILEGAFIRQYDDEEEGWTYDDTVWGVRLYIPEIAELSDSYESPYSLRLYRTYLMDDGSFNLDMDAGPVDEMTFTNTYTEHSYELKYDEKNHWDECSGCKDKQNAEPHKYGDWKVIKAATQTAKGEKEHTCTICGYTEKTEIAKLPAADTTDTTKNNQNTGAATSPNTGDNSHMALWLALLFVSGAGVIGTTVYGKKKRAK